jgi:hypothetical protein
MAEELAENITLLLPDIAASRLSKKHPCFFGSYFPNPLKKKEKPARTAGSKQGG